MQPLVSVIVPNFNHVAFLRERLESILAQTFTDFELILLDDASTDASPAILREFATDPRVSHLVVNVTNSGGPFSQWARGLELARGTYVWIAESDDACDPGFLDAMVELLEAGADLAYCRSVRMNGQGVVVSDYYWPDGLDDGKWRKDYRALGVEELRNALAYRNTIPNASACVFRRSRAFIGTALSGMRYAGDWLFWVDLLREGSVAYRSEAMNRFRSQPLSTRTTKTSEEERRRLEENIRVIGHARDVVHMQWSWREWGRYAWLFQEIFAKRTLLGGPWRAMAAMPMGMRRLLVLWWLYGRYARLRMQFRGVSAV